MEWTQHQIDAVEIKGFPTLVFFKKGGKKAEQIKFQKACSTESMEEFIKENISFQREDL